jgi:hypothetical protein
MPNVLNDIAEIAVAFNSWAAMITAFPSSGGSPAAGLVRHPVFRVGHLFC